MRWSVAQSKMFNKCQRKWFYYGLVANANSNDLLRKEVYYLKQLKSIAQWRGSLADIVINDYIAPKLRSNEVPDKDEVLKFADELIECQIQFGKEKKYRENKVSKTRVGNRYCAFYDIEYKGLLVEESLECACKEVETAINNLLDSQLLQDIAYNNQYLISQRSLRFELFNDVRVICVPDMIVFFENQPPLIIDWKVHSFGSSDAWLQLGIYSLALSRVLPHKDFPESFKNYSNTPTNFQLLEYQLLKNVQRSYSITQADLLDIEDYILWSSSQMKHLVNGKNINEIDFSIFKTARRPQICTRCQFKKLCWTHKPERLRKPFQLTLSGYLNE